MSATLKQALSLALYTESSTNNQGPLTQLFCQSSSSAFIHFQTNTNLTCWWWWPRDHVVESSGKTAPSFLKYSTALSPVQSEGRCCCADRIYCLPAQVNFTYCACAHARCPSELIKGTVSSYCKNPMTNKYWFPLPVITATARDSVCVCVCVSVRAGWVWRSSF